ncbi:MAG: hypothetical protein R6U32_00530 [Candidatus Woesearchaeota archaeon]
MGETVSIPKEEYEFLKKCEEVVKLESDDDLSPELLKRLEKAERDIKEGKGKKFSSAKEVEEYLKAM